MNKTRLLIACMLFLNVTLWAQQNHSLFLLHDLPQSNLLNPAVKLPCKYVIGLPVLSSVHVNFANNFTSYNQLITNNTTNIDAAVNNLHWRNYIGFELHVQWLSLGYNYNDYSFTFAATEKINLPITFPKNVFELGWLGNSMFEGKKAGLKGTGVYLNHYREYAFGASKLMDNGGRLGVKAKLLFGKLNTSSRSTDIGIETDETSFALNFDGDLLINSSLPILVDASNNRINNAELNPDFDPMQFALNRKNPGIAFDAGIIYPYSENITLSASIIDLGLIRWRSNLNTFEGSGRFQYAGFTGNINQSGGYFNNLTDAFLDSINFAVTQQKYTTFLPPRVIAGASYRVNSKISAGATFDAIFYRSKVIPSITLMAQAEPLQNIHFMASYNVQYYSYNNIGAGIVIGQNPVQFYLSTDNLMGIIWPMRSRTANVRIGLNIIFGCQKTQNKAIRSSGKNKCYGVENPYNKPYHKLKNR